MIDTGERPITWSGQCGIGGGIKWSMIDTDGRPFTWSGQCGIGDGIK